MQHFSLLDLSPIPEGKSVADALANTVDLARAVEAAGYNRYWLAEHHNMPGIASAATSIVIGHVAGASSRIRVGAGGVMLPNHAPLVVAEQFGTLATLYPGRIDLGLGRAPGSDMATARALRCHMAPEDSFPQDVLELIGYLEDAPEDAPVRAIPGVGTKVPVWILGSQELTYFLAWESLVEREQLRTAFAKDPEWVAARAAHQAVHGEVVANIASSFLEPTTFSKMI
jgi:luciferase family oxidoreductase group 1